MHRALVVVLLGDADCGHGTSPSVSGTFPYSRAAGMACQSLAPRALDGSLGRRGFGFVIALTALVTVAGAAGRFAFENQVPDGLDTCGQALWWTVMIMTTFGSLRSSGFSRCAA